MSINDRQFSLNNSQFRYGFNNKENDNDIEIGAQDYGKRIYDNRICRFLSTDPLTKKYPELTPYQFASNTPMQAVDLDGLEAAKIDFTARGTYFFVSVGIGVSVVAAPDGIAFFISPEAGVGAGFGGGAGLSWSYYPKVTEASQLGGWGVNAGASFNGASAEISVSVQQDKNGHPTGTKVGGGTFIPGGGEGVGLEGHVNASYSFQIGSTISWKDVAKNVTLIAADIGMDPTALQDMVDKLKAAQTELAQQQKITPPVTASSTKNNSGQASTALPAAKTTANKKSKNANKTKAKEKSADQKKQPKGGTSNTQPSSAFSYLAVMQVIV
jgi:RHS repeat-associated protein